MYKASVCTRVPSTDAATEEADESATVQKLCPAVAPWTRGIKESRDPCVRK